MIIVTGDPARNSAYVFAHNGVLGYPVTKKIANVTRPAKAPASGKDAKSAPEAPASAKRGKHVAAP
jgi:hypothetical protein